MTGLRDKIIARYKELKKPMSAMFEVTDRCMCSCIHCYLSKNPSDELTIDEIKDLFKQMKEIGIINLGITGGEPFLRKDIFDIIELANQNNFFLSLLTTGILLDSEKIKRLKDLNVNSLEMSLLGVNAETHDFIMNYPGAFNKLMNSINLLKKAGINSVLKSTILKNNYKELDDMFELAKSLEVEFEANITISSKTDGDMTPLEYMISPLEYEQIDLNKINGGFIPGDDYSKGALLTCNAGLLSISITPNGDIIPCLLLRKKIGNIRENSLIDILINHPDPFLIELRNIKDEDVKDCFNCDIKKYCRRCPGISYLETKKIACKNPSACYLAKLSSLKNFSRNNNETAD